MDERRGWNTIFTLWAIIEHPTTQELTWNFLVTLILVTLMCLILFTALVIFGIRLYLNDLYVSIPDRLLVTCALAQILHDIPVEALIADGNIWEASPYLKVSWTFLGLDWTFTCLKQLLLKPLWRMGGHRAAWKMNLFLLKRLHEFKVPPRQ